VFLLCFVVWAQLKKKDVININLEKEISSEDKRAVRLLSGCTMQQ